MNIREIASSAAGDQDLLAQTICVFEYRDAASALARLDRAHQAGGSGSENQGVKFLDHWLITCRKG